MGERVEDTKTLLCLSRGFHVIRRELCPVHAPGASRDLASLLRPGHEGSFSLVNARDNWREQTAAWLRNGHQHIYRTFLKYSEISLNTKTLPSYKLYEPIQIDNDLVPIDHVTTLWGPNPCSVQTRKVCPWIEQSGTLRSVQKWHL